MAKRSIEDIKESAPSLSLPFEEFKNKITQYHMVYNEEIKDLINQNPHLLNEVDHRGYSALHLAAENNNSDIVTFLIKEKNSSPNKLVLYKRYTPLYVAAENGCDDAVKSLLNANANPNIGALCDRTPLTQAAKNGHYKVVESLLNAGAQLISYVNMGVLALNDAAKNGHYKIVELLVESSLKKYPLEIRSDIKKVIVQKALYHAVKGGHVEVVESFIEEGANLETMELQRTALHWASFNGRIELVKFLLNKNVEFNERDINGNTALHLAAEKGLELMKILPKKYLGGNKYKFAEIVINYFEVVKLLVNVNNNQPDEVGNYTALHLAAAMGNTDVIQLLVSKNVDLNKCDNDGKTALHFAIDNRRFEIVEPLSSSDRACLYDAVTNGHTRTIKSFLKKAVEVNICDKDDKIALDLVIKEIIEALLNAGANPTIKYQGKTVLDIAVANDYTEVVKLLKNREIKLTKLEDSGNEYTEVAPADLSDTPPINLAYKNEDITVIGNSSTSMNVDE